MSTNSILSAVACLGAALWWAGCGSSPHWDVDRDGVVRLAVLGDSNSTILKPDVWNLQLQDTLERLAPGQWDVRSYAQLGAVITHTDQTARDGETQVKSALADRPRAEVVILAFGTNDLRNGRTPQQVVAAYVSAVQEIEQAGARVLIAYTPPCYQEKCDLAAIAAQNDQLDAALPAVPKLDFFSWATPTDLIDRLHFSAAGHGKRRDAALRILLR